MYPRFSHLHSLMSIVVQFAAGALRSRANNFQPQAHGAGNRRKRNTFRIATLPSAGLLMFYTATTRSAGRFQRWTARWATLNAAIACATRNLQRTLQLHAC